MSTSDHPSSVRQALLTALGLSMASAIALGLSRFSYALLLAPMRADLGWSYLLAGAMNTANAVGYLLGALITPFLTRRIGVQAVLWSGGLAACVFLIGPALVLDAAPQLVLRLFSGVASALVLITGGVLATRLAGMHPGAAAASASSCRRCCCRPPCWARPASGRRIRGRRHGCCWRCYRCCRR
jgi:predicted MFS family arabinose efflux permease